MRRVVVIAALTVLILAAGMVLLQETSRVFGGTPRWSGQWVTTWSGATQPFVPRYFAFGAPLPPEFADAYEKGVLQDQTIRMVVQSTLSGNRVRIRLSNQYGKQPLTIGAARIGKLSWTSSGQRDPVFGRGYSAAPGTEREILFEGKATVTIPPGEVLRSDPVSFETSDRGFMQVSLYIRDKTDPATWVSQTTFSSVLRGNATALSNQQQARGLSLRGGYWLAGVEVYALKDSKAILIIDDDGIERNRGKNPGWTEPFKDRLFARFGPNRFAVLDASIGNCSMNAVCNVYPLHRLVDARYHRRGVKWVILGAGFMDLRIAAASLSRPPGQNPQLTPEHVIRAQKAFIDVAHDAGIKVYGVTYPPFSGYHENPEELETMRVAVNNWIRTSGAFDKVADFDRVLRDSANPTQMLYAYRDTASLAMANEFDLSAF